jgi:hypothetical protein
MLQTLRRYNVVNGISMSDCLTTLLGILQTTKKGLVLIALSLNGGGCGAPNAGLAFQQCARSLVLKPTKTSSSLWECYVHQIADNKKGLPVWIALSLNGSLAMCYSRMGRPQTTIAANVFHFWVRNGIRWCHIAIVARQKLLSIKLSLNKWICKSWYPPLAGQAVIEAKECL